MKTFKVWDKRNKCYYKLNEKWGEKIALTQDGEIISITNFGENQWGSTNYLGEDLSVILEIIFEDK